MTNSIQSFGQWVRERRKQRHLTQKALGQLIGYAEITVRQIENDSYNLTRFVVDCVVTALAVEHDDRDAIVRFALHLSATDEAAIQSSGRYLSMTPFFGRESELAHIQVLLRSSECHCVSIVGIGGVGKTRLATRTFETLTREEIVGYVNLAGVLSIELLPSAIAHILNISLTPFAAPEEQILRALESRQMLLVLDNYEHLLPEGTVFVRAIMERAPRVKLMITSRERLGLSGEWCIRLDGLNTFDQSSMSDAAQLFISTATRINHQFVASELNTIHQICRVAQGIPLAIEMAASWTEVQTCQDILKSLSVHVLGLTGRQRQMDGRHGTLQAVFESTWSQLSATGQSTLKRLSVFRSGFTAYAAQYVAGADRDMLAFLVDKMLIQPHDNGRLTLHEMIRELAFQKLTLDPDDLLHSRLRHGRYFVDFLQASAERLKYRYAREEIARLLPEIENLREAWITILQHRKTEWFFECYEVFWLFWNITGNTPFL